MFYVGQKVVCVGDDGFAHPNPAMRPVPSPNVGEIYTVSHIAPAEFGVGRGRSITIVAEIDPTNPKWPGLIFGYDSSCFRPVVDRKTDISALVKIAEEAARTGKVLA